MRREAEREAFGAVEPRPGERKEHPDAAFEPWEVPAAADVGKQADPRLGHGEARMFGCDAIFRGLRNADPAAHGDPVHEGDDGLGVSEQQMVEAIFGVEERPRFDPVLRSAFRQHADVAPGAEAAALAMVDDHRFDRVVIAPFDGKRIDHRFTHGEVQRMDRLGRLSDRRRCGRRSR